MTTWRNWGRNQSVEVDRVHSPRRPEDIVGLVTGAAAEGRRLKAVGAGHSFTGIAVADRKSTRLNSSH